MANKGRETVSSSERKRERHLPEDTNQRTEEAAMNEVVEKKMEAFFFVSADASERVFNFFTFGAT